MFEGITWQGVGLFVLILIAGSFIAGFIDCALEQRRRDKEQLEREKLQRKGGE